MLRILAGSLLSGALLLGPVAASSFLSPPPMEAEAGPSLQVVDEAREVAPPIDPTVTAAYGDEDDRRPEVIPAPRYVVISRSISAMVPTGESESFGIAALDEDAEEERGLVNRRQARQLPPMVIRGGLVGEAFPAPGTSSSALSAQAGTPQTSGERAASSSGDQEEPPAAAPSAAAPM